MADYSDEYDLDPQVSTARKDLSQPQSTPSIIISIITRFTITQTIQQTSACGSTQTTGRC
jgi:hypothetical protein